MSTVLVCTDVAAMGLDVDDLNLTVNIGNFIQIIHLLFCNNIIWKKAYLAQLGSWNSKLDVVVGMVSQLLTSHWFFLREVIISHLKNSTFISELRTLCYCMLPWYGLVFVLLWMTYGCSEYFFGSKNIPHQIFSSKKNFVSKKKIEVQNNFWIPTCVQKYFWSKKMLLTKNCLACKVYQISPGQMLLSWKTKIEPSMGK